MITFETQEDFDEAVMQVLESRLRVDVAVNHVGSYFSDATKEVEVELTDSLGGSVCSGSAQLPTPSITY